MKNNLQDILRPLIQFNIRAHGLLHSTQTTKQQHVHTQFSQQGQKLLYLHNVIGP